MAKSIIIKGAAENNLKNVDVCIPKEKLVVFAGVSGSGKSSLVFDTIARESSRQMWEMLPQYVRNRMPHEEAPKVRVIDNLSPAVMIDQRPFTGDMRSTVGTLIAVAPLLRLLFSRCAKPYIGYSQAYSSADPLGMCLNCGGLGYTVRFDPDKFLDKDKSLQEGAIRLNTHRVDSAQWQLYANSGFFDVDKKLRDYTQKEMDDLLHGSGVVVPIKNATGSVLGDYHLQYEGLMDRIDRLYLNRDAGALNASGRKVVDAFTTRRGCDACGGSGLNAAALGSLLLGKSIAQMAEMEIAQLIPLLSQLQDPVGVPTAKQIIRVLQAVVDMGLGYLTLDRKSTSLSGGEAQRLRILRHLGTSFVGLTFIFDEPSVGLHPKDVDRLGDLLIHLRDRGNSVLVVEHNHQLIQAADHVVELGPGAGKNGGTIVFEGSPESLRTKGTATGTALRKQVRLTARERVFDSWFQIRNASLNNLKGIDVRFPKGGLTVITGLSGAGKSSLACGVLPEQYPDAVCITQGPIGTTSKSNPATYTGVMDMIREGFARECGVDAGMFSYNSLGACPTCQGKGFIKTEMAFMDPVSVPCEVCGGRRYRQEALQYRFRGKNILDVLDMTIDEAVAFFEEPRITEKLEYLQQIGMGYMTLGQPTSTLSGGECQRVKLAARLKSRAGILVLDEPSNGLHGADVELLLAFLDKLIAMGNTIVLVEHDPEIIAHADWVIDLGPEGGKNGGRLVFEGTPEQLLSCPASETARYLAGQLSAQQPPAP